MSSAQLYDSIGATYTVTRRTEPRIAARVWAALGDARTVLNVGAGTGSYEPPGRDVTAVEPSALMRAQRPAGAAPCVAAVAESLPFEDQSFDAAMAFATVHHWQDPIAGLREMRRVARRVVVFTFDASETGWRRRFWLTRDYLPEFAELLVGRPSLTEMARAIGARMEPVLIPWDCADGFFEAYWRRPEAYLDDQVRRGISVWARVGPEAEQRAVRSLRDDLASGRWEPDPGRQRVDGNQVRIEFVEVDWIVAVDSGVGRPECDVSAARIDQPPVLIAFLVSQCLGDLLQVEAIQFQHVTEHRRRCAIAGVAKPVTTFRYQASGIERCQAGTQIEPTALLQWPRRQPGGDLTLTCSFWRSGG
jgi:SAM-dependent methyltransferase